MVTEDQVHKRLMDLHRQLGSQKKLAEYLGVSTPYVHELMHRTRKISDAIALKLGYKSSRTFEEQLHVQAA